MPKVLLILISFFIATASLFANIYPISLAERIDSSEKVILAIAINKESYWDADSTDIYTSYTMKVICYAKNHDNHHFFDLILPGGTVGEDVQVNYPFMELTLGNEYLVTVENVTLFQLNRKHRARSSNSKFQPYSYVQGVLPMNNGSYSDYSTDTLMQEADLFAYIANNTSEEARTPKGDLFESRDSFPISNGDLDSDGVMDIYDENPNDPFSDSDGDGISDWLETNPDPITDPNTGASLPGYVSNPLNACDPAPSSSCIGLDFDGDGRFSNYAPHHVDYDMDDEDQCIPYALAGCTLIDNDGDGLFGNLLPNDPHRDTNDNNPCEPSDFFQLNAHQDTYIDFSNPTAINGNKSNFSIRETSSDARRAVIQFEDIPDFIPPSAYSIATLHLHIEHLDHNSGIIFNALPFQWDESVFSWILAAMAGDFLFDAPITQTGWVAIDVPVSVIINYLNTNSESYGIVLRTQGSDMTISSSESANAPYITIQLDPENCQLPPSRADLSNETKSENPVVVTLKDGVGTVTNTFFAGTTDPEHEMIIEGDGFGDTPGIIEFPNADNGGASNIAINGSDLLYWTNTKIKIKVPRQAGSGQMEIKTADGHLIGTENILIDWSLIPLYHDFKSFDKPTRQRIHFVDANEEGGYTFHLNTTSGFSTNVEAVAAFERAIQKWQCASQVNWTVDKSGTSIEKGNDGISVIQFSKDLPVGVLGLASSRYKASGGSSCNQGNTLWRVNEMDIEFADPSILPPGFSWHFSEESPLANNFDFESIVLHELGHAHGLGHVTNDESIMHFSIPNGVRRDLVSSDLAAASHKMSYSLEDKCVTSHNPMVALEDCETATPPLLNVAQVKVLLEGYYNAADGNMRTELQETSLLPLSNPYNIAPFNYFGTEAIDSIPAGIIDWVLVELRDTANTDSIVHQQAVLLRKDGWLVTTSGDTTLNFEGIPNGSYYIAIHHKSHLPIISSIAHSLGIFDLAYDFTSAATTAMGEAQLKEIEGQYYMFSGDFDNNGAINNLDYNIWKLNSAAINIYSVADADGNGIINSLDYNLLQVNLSKIGTLRR